MPKDAFSDVPSGSTDALERMDLAERCKRSYKPCVYNTIPRTPSMLQERVWICSSRMTVLFLQAAPIREIKKAEGARSIFREFRKRRLVRCAI